MKNKKVIKKTKLIRNWFDSKLNLATLVHYLISLSISIEWAVDYAFWANIDNSRAFLAGIPDSQIKNFLELTVGPNYGSAK